MRKGPIAILVAILALLGFVPSPSAACITRHSVRVGSGSSPTGEPWIVAGNIGNNGSCGEWLFGMDFELPGAINWGWSTGIPVGGHLPKNFTIDASDDLQQDGSQRVFSGTVGGDVARVVAILSNGTRLAIHPKLPSAKLRRQVVWLRNVRYFVQYYPPKGFVISASLFSASGKLLHRTPLKDGGF